VRLQRANDFFQAKRVRVALENRDQIIESASSKFYALAVSDGLPIKSGGHTTEDYLILTVQYLNDKHLENKTHIARLLARERLFEQRHQLAQSAAAFWCSIKMRKEQPPPKHTPQFRGDLVLSREPSSLSSFSWDDLSPPTSMAMHRMKSYRHQQRGGADNGVSLSRPASSGDLSSEGSWMVVDNEGHSQCSGACMRFRQLVERLAYQAASAVQESHLDYFTMVRAVCLVPPAEEAKKEESVSLRAPQSRMPSSSPLSFSAMSSSFLGVTPEEL
jgi:hypothetical protein